MSWPNRFETRFNSFAIVWKPDIDFEIRRKNWGLTTFHHILFQWVICDIRIETVARNQTNLIFQSLVCNTGLLLWATGGNILQNRYKRSLFHILISPVQSVKPMAHICTYLGLAANNFESGTLLCHDQDISSDDLEVFWSLLSQSFSSKYSSLKIQVHMWRIGQVCEYILWNVGLPLLSSQHSHLSVLNHRVWGPREGKGQKICLILMDTLWILQCQLSSKAGLHERWAETYHKLSCCPSLGVQFQGDCSPPGRNRRVWEQREEDCLLCQESGGPGGGTALERRCSHLEWKFRWEETNQFTKMLVYVLESVTIWLLETLLNQTSVVGKKWPSIRSHSFHLCDCWHCQ